MHTRNTRYCNLNLFCPRCSYATEGGRSFTVRSIREWNSLPRSLRVLDSYSRFKTRLLKKFLVTQKKKLEFLTLDDIVHISFLIFKNIFLLKFW